MFDAVTRELIAGAPALDGLVPSDLHGELTAAYVEIAAARLSLAQIDEPFSPELSRSLVRMSRLADAYEARIVLDLDSDRRRSTAFVAASARQFIALAARLRRPEATTSRLDEDAVGADIASALLFLIAERSADAFEVARDIQAAGEPNPIRRALILAIGRLARGRLEDILAIDLAAERLGADDAFGEAADLLFRELLAGVILLAQEGLGLAEGGATAAASARFETVRRLAIDTGAEDALAPSGLRAISAFPGPHHLAGLLLRAASTLRDSMLVRTPTPGGANAERWTAWVREEAARWPYVWENHRRAIATGYLECGQSLVMTSPTGSGKTTLAALKIASTITSGKTVLYLAPTHALVGQVERDLNERVGGLATAESVDDTTVEDILPALPTLAVVTPERCFALLTFAPELFVNVGLLVFDECHLLGIGRNEDGATANRVDRRSVDAMLCLLTFLSTAPQADLLLLSAMVSNGPEVAKWLGTLMGRPVHPFDDRWKPTRQLRCCVTYDSKELVASRMAANTKGGKPAGTPLGLFSLVSGWNPGAPDKLVLRPLSPTPIALGAGGKAPRRYVTANRFEVAARIADGFERAGLKVIIFCDSIPRCVSTAKALNDGQDPLASARDAEQDAWRDAAIAELGSAEAIYDAGERRAAVHHGELLPEERRLVETLFRKRESGVNVLAATSTLAQGLNLPCEVVILAGTDRVEESDPVETTRTPLAAHEILNALGRAGRAGVSATGLAVVVPGNPIACDAATKWIAASEDLPVIFADGDQCLPLQDPLTTLFDQVEVAGVSGSEAAYLLRRLAVSLGPAAEASAFDSLARRTFGFHVRQSLNAPAAEVWLANRRAVLTSAIQATAEPPAQPWEEELAAKTGATRRFILALATAYPTAPRDALDAKSWIGWLLDQFDPAMDDVDAFLRPDTMARVFGRAYSSQHDVAARRNVALAGVKAVLNAWFAGEPLLQLEKQIAGFIAANEIGVKQPTRADAKAKHARRFALRLAPDLGFLCGVLAQVATKQEAEAGNAPPPMLQFLPQLVRRGYATPYHFALSRSTPSASRVTVQESYGAVAPHLQRSAADDWNVIQENLRDAQVKLAFNGLSFES
jgi:superfamily II DNA/RNA helicase